MSILDRMGDAISKGASKARDAYSKAKAAAGDLGEQAVISMDIARLEKQRDDMLSTLGALVYETFEKRGRDSVSRDHSETKSIVAGIKDVEARLSERRNALDQTKQRRGNTQYPVPTDRQP